MEEKLHYRKTNFSLREIFLGKIREIFVSGSGM